MLLFVYVFGGALNTGGKYVDYVVPGLIVLCAGFGAGTTAVAVATDMTNGIVDRFRSMPITGSSVLSATSSPASPATWSRPRSSSASASASAGARPASPAHWVGCRRDDRAVDPRPVLARGRGGLLARTPEAANSLP